MKRQTEISDNEKYACRSNFTEQKICLPKFQWSIIVKKINGTRFNSNGSKKQ